MIVLTNQPAGSPYSSKSLAGEILAKLKENVPFEELARIYSNGTQAQEGGSWGWVQKSVLRADLSGPAFALEPGKFSEPLETPSGIYIMLVEDKKVSYTKSLPEVRDEIEGVLKAEENKRVRKQWVDQLKAKSFVRYF
jgi:parvulin-like peptidyl-prolyl isomerase